jgi:hypothetical protein
MYKIRRKHLLSLITVAALSSLTSCGETEFSSTSSNKASLDSKSGSDSAGADALGELGNIILGEEADGSIIERVVSIKTSKESTTDILWVLDNSGSMTAEIAQVSENMLKFFNGVKSATSAKVGVISALSGSNALNLSPALKSELVTDPTRVGSRDSFDKVLNFLGGDGSGFFRPDSLSVMVFVTDDNANMKHDDFMKRLDGHLDTSKLKTYAFAGIPTSSGCGIAQTGTEYIDMASKTKGEVFDICEKDWSKHFNLLTTSIISSVSSAFDLNKSIESIKKVNVNGVELTPDQYSYEGNVLKITAGLISEGGVEIEVQYYPVK